MTDKTLAAVAVSTGIGMLCLAAAPVIGALCTALVERIAGLAYSLSPQGASVVRIAGAVLSGVAIATLINGVVYQLFGGQFGHWPVYLVTLAFALAAYAAIFLVRLVLTGEFAAVFALREWRDGYVSLATGLYLVYGPAVAAGYTATYWLFHLGFRHIASA